jgi:hypothetical protein
MSDTSTIDKLVEIIKAYFSIAGLITLGVYLAKNVSAAPFHWHIVHYLGGWLAIGLGSVIGVWSAIHNVTKFHASRQGSRHRTALSLAIGALMILGLPLMLSIVIGAVAMSCSESP